MDKTLQLNPNEVVAYLGKDPSTFTWQDMLDFIVAKEIRMIDFMYPAEDAQLYGQFARLRRNGPR